MIAHVVLFQPRATSRRTERDAFAASFEHALTSIPQVRRARVGARRTLGRALRPAERCDFSFVAIIEFDSEADLLTYLDHPAHEELGRRFYETAEAALVYDFELTEGAGASGVFQRRRTPTSVSTKTRNCHRSDRLPFRRPSPFFVSFVATLLCESEAFNTSLAQHEIL